MRIATLAVCAGLLLACSRKTPDKAQPEPSAKTSMIGPADAGASAEPVGEFSGTIRGIVKLAPDASVPMAPPVLSHGVKPPSMKPCPEVDVNDQRVVSQAKETGGLSPIHVALTGMKSAPPAELKTHELFIDACRLRPTILGVHKGDVVKVTNRSEMALVPQLPGASFMRGLLRGESQTFDVSRVQTKVQCSFGSYCGEALVIATTHTLYDVTTNEGFFTIKDVPLEQPVTVHAWHPLFDENSAKVTLTREKPEQMVEILLTPAPPKAAEEAPKEQRDEFERKLPDGGVISSKSRVVVKKAPK